MKVGYKTLNQDPTGSGSDLGDIFIPKNLFTQGGLWLWGRNNYGQLATNDTTTYSSPVQTVSGGSNWKYIDSSVFHTAAIKIDGTLWLWGYNDSGQLGDNSIVRKSSPVQTVSGGSNWKLVSAGIYHTATIKTDGTLWLWGRNSYGQLATNNRTNYSSPVQTVSGGSNWKSVATLQHHTVAIKTDGTLWLWGFNDSGQLGDNSIANKSSPVQTVSGGTNWKLVSSGGYSTAAIKTDGTLWLWGRNNYGQLATNNRTNYSSPVQTVSGGSNWKSISLSSNHTVAIKTDGTLWSWGFNGSGQLGDNTNVSKSSPVQTISGGVNWKQISAGGAQTASIKTDGTLWMWGINTNGQLGDNTIARKSSPIQTITGGTNWKSISSKGTSVGAIREDYY